MSGNEEPVAVDWLNNSDEMGKLISSIDWSQTPLGGIKNWSQSLRTSISICLSSRFPILIWWGTELVMIYNDAYRPILGAKHPKAMGQSGQECWSEIWDVIGPMLEGVLTDGKATWSENQLLLVDRHGYLEECYFTFSYSPITDETGGIGGVFTAVTETTQQVIGERRLQTLQNLAANTAKAKTVEDVHQAAIATLAANTNCIPFALLYRIEPDGKQAHLAGVTGLEAETAMSPKVVNLTQTQGWQFEQVKATGQSQLVENLSTRFGGNRTTIANDAIMLPLTQAGDRQKIVGFLVFGINPQLAFDVKYQSFFELVAGNVETAIANAEAYEAERKRAEALAELNRAKNTFFSNVSHEFRTPLTLMLDPLNETLSSLDGQLPRIEQEQLQMVQRNGQRLLKLVNMLLDFSRIEAGRIAAVYESTDLATFTAELASFFRPAIAQAHLSLIVDCPPLAEPAWVDHEMWEKIVLNLLSNAFKFTFEGQITIMLREQNHQIELEIRDTGIGIPASELPHIFERFHRVREAKGRTYEGSGIGLSLVQELVQLHGGTISVSSVIDQGTSFVVSIPTGCAHLRQEYIQTTRPQNSTATGADLYVEELLHWLPEEGNEETPFSGPIPYSLLSTLGTAQILLVDDNSDMRNYLRRLLSKQGYKVKTATDGMAALAAIEQQIPDLVLADVMMPQLDGFGLLRELRTTPKTREIPIILLSARAGEEARIEGLEAGADDYLTKPFSARELLARVEATLKLAQLRREVSTAIQRSEDRLRLAIRLAQLGTWRYDPNTNLVELDERMREIWGVTAEMLTLSQVFERIHKDDLPRVARAVSDAFDPMSSGVYEIDYRIVWDDGTERWICANGQAIFAGEGTLRQAVELLGTALDISDRKGVEEISRRSAEFNAFRVSLSDALRPLADPLEIQATANRVLGEYLGANRVAYFEVRGADYIVQRDYVNGAEALAGSYPVESFGSKLLAEYRNGRAVTASDVKADPNLSPAQRSAYAAIQIGAYIGIPLIKEGKFLAGLAVHSSGPRAWTPDEVALTEEVAECTWAAVERSRALGDLCESEEKYRTLFEGINEGFCVVEMIYDTDGQPFDYRFLQANPAFKLQTGLTDVVGKTALDLAPHLGMVFVEKYKKVLRTGEAQKFEIYTAHLDCYFDVSAYCYGKAESKQIAVVFTNITERKRREAHLAFLAEIQDDLTYLTCADEIMLTTGAKIGALLGASSSFFVDIDEKNNEARIHHIWNAKGVPHLSELLIFTNFVSEEFKRAGRAGETIVCRDTNQDERTDANAYAVFDIHSFITVPYHWNGQEKFLLTICDSKARNWREDEIELFRELANRIFWRLERARAEADIAADLQATQLLRELGVRLVIEGDIQTLYQEIISAAIALTRADGGTVQILDEAGQNLVMLATQGFDQNMTEHFYRVNASSNTPWGIALKNGERIFVDFDVPESEDFDGSMRMHVEAGYQSAQSTPLITRSGKLIGMVSTHWHEYRRPSERELRFLDLLARQATDLIEQRQTEGALRKSEELLRLTLEASKLGMWFWNLENDHFIWTEQCKALFGLSTDTAMSYETFLTAPAP